MTNAQDSAVEAFPAFEREKRYIVVKRKHLTPFMESAIFNLLAALEVRTFECVVVESDWPEYETVWAMIEARVATPATPATCPQCNGFGYLVTAPSTCSAGGERMSCPVCKPFGIIAASASSDQEKLVGELVEALESVLDPDPCLLDHNGNCQTHFVTNPCEVAVARALITRTRLMREQQA